MSTSSAKCSDQPGPDNVKLSTAIAVSVQQHLKNLGLTRADFRCLLTDHDPNTRIAPRTADKFWNGENFTCDTLEAVMQCCRLSVTIMQCEPGKPPVVEVADMMGRRDESKVHWLQYRMTEVRRQKSQDKMRRRQAEVTPRRKMM